MIDHTVTTFISSERGRQLSTKRVLFHAGCRLKEYDPSRSTVIQRTIPPVSVAVCPTSFCVRKCVFCSNALRNAENQKCKAEYTDSAFASLISDLTTLGVQGVSIAGGGEPLLYDKSGLKDLIIAANPSYRIGLHTNGVLLDRILTNEIVGSGTLQYVNISGVAHTPQLYRSVTGGDSMQFSRIEKNLRLALRMASDTIAFPTFGVKILINRANYLDIKAITDYFSALGVKEILLRCVGNFEPGQDVELTSAQRSQLVEILRHQLNMPEKQIVAVTGSRDASLPIPSRCWIMALQYTAGIDPDGEVYLCSPWSRKQFSIGNINTQRLACMWGSRRHMAVAAELNAKMKRGECNPLLCRHYYSNLAIDGYLSGQIALLQKDRFEDMFGRFI